jgi:hypothetical protein
MYKSINRAIKNSGHKDLLIRKSGIGLGVVLFAVFILASWTVEEVAAPFQSRFGKKMHEWPTNYDACLRYAHVKIKEEEGLGHRVSDLVFGMLFAFENNARLWFNSSGFETNGKHGAYPWAVEFFGWTEMVVSPKQKHELNMSREWVSKWSDAYKFKDSCNILIETCDACCTDVSNPVGDNDLGWCFSRKPGAFNMVRQQMQQMFKKKTVQSDPEFYHEARRNNKLVIAWHIREGDVTLNASPEYLELLYGQLATAVAGISHSIFVFQEKPLSEKFSRFKNLTSFEHKPWADVRTTLHHLIASDVLVTSGSSFVSVAALYFEGAIVLQAPTKQDDPFGMYEMEGEGVIAENGSIIYPGPNELKSRILEYAMMHGIKMEQL